MLVAATPGGAHLFNEHPHISHQHVVFSLHHGAPEASVVPWGWGSPIFPSSSLAGLDLLRRSGGWAHSGLLPSRVSFTMGPPCAPRLLPSTAKSPGLLPWQLSQVTHHHPQRWCCPSCEWSSQTPLLLPRRFGPGTSGIFSTLGSKEKQVSKDQHGR